MLKFCQIIIVALHPAMGELGRFQVHQLPCFECRKIVRDNATNIRGAEAKSGLQITMTCYRDSR